MPEMIKFFKVAIFADNNYRPMPGNINISPMEILLPLDAISHLTERERGRPQSGYNIHIKKNYPLDAPFPIKEINPGYITFEQVELLGLGRL